MLQKIFLTFSLLAAGIASAAAHNLTLFQDSIVNGKELKSGDYRMVVKDSTVVISKGKASVEAPVKVETAENKFNTTTVRYMNGDGKFRVQEIRIGGTKTKLIFEN